MAWFKHRVYICVYMYDIYVYIICINNNMPVDQVSRYDTLLVSTLKYKIYLMMLHEIKIQMYNFMNESKR